MPAQHIETLHTSSKSYLSEPTQVLDRYFSPKQRYWAVRAVVVLLSGHKIPPEVETSQVQGKLPLHLEVVGNPLSYSSD